MFPCRLSLLLGALTALSCGAAPVLPCFVELPMYDPLGKRLSFNVVRVIATMPAETGDLLQSTGPHRMIWKDNRLRYAKGIPITGISITVDGGKDERGRRVGFTEKVALYGCEQRVSLEYGSRGAGVAVSATTVRGRISGCSLSGDWWVRAVPMFGAPASSMVVYEGYLQKANGSFEITASMRGERHIITIGRGRDPIISLGADVVEGGMNNDVGTIDLQGKCPQ